MPKATLRAVAYVDGLNLYNGMAENDDENGLLTYRWLDIEHMCKMLADDAGGHLGQPIHLARVTYCTSWVRDHQGRIRQDTWLEAVQSHSPDVSVRYGKYDQKTQKCECGRNVSFPKEKQTDVNLAVEMMRDAAGRPVDVGAAVPELLLLVSGDTDLIPAIRAVQETFKLPIVVAAPPERGQPIFGQEATKYLRVGRRHLKYSPLPGAVPAAANGYVLTPPGSWAHPDTW